MRTVPNLYAEHCSPGAVPRVPADASRTLPATRVDLADNALADKFGFSWRAFDHTHKLMPYRPLESRVTLNYLDVCIADSAFQHADQGLSGLIRPWHLLYLQFTLFESQRFHNVEIYNKRPANL